MPTDFLQLINIKLQVCALPSAFIERRVLDKLFFGFQRWTVSESTHIILYSGCDCLTTLILRLCYMSMICSGNPKKIRNTNIRVPFLCKLSMHRFFSSFFADRNQIWQLFCIFFFCLPFLCFLFIIFIYSTI